MVLSGPDDGGNDNPHGRTQSPGDCPGFQSRRRHPRRAGPPAGSLPGMDRRRLPRRDGLSGAARPCGPPPRPGGHPARRALAGRRGSRLRHRATAGGSHRRPQPRPLLQLRLGRGLPRRDDAAVGGVGRVAGEGSAGEQGGRGAGETASSCRRGRYTPSPSGRGMGRGPATPSPFGRGLGRGRSQPRLHRHRRPTGARPRRDGRAGLYRQEHPAHRPAARLLVLSGGAADDVAARL